MELAKNFLYRRSLLDPSAITRSWGIRLCRLCLTCSRWTLLLLLCTVLRRLIARDLRLLASHSYGVLPPVVHIDFAQTRKSHIDFCDIVNIFRYVLRSKRKKKMQWNRFCFGLIKFLEKCVLQFSNFCVTILTQLWKDAYCSVRCVILEKIAQKRWQLS